MTATMPEVPSSVVGARTLVEVRLRSNRLETWFQVVAGFLVLAFLIHQLGTGPFLDGLRAVSPLAVLAALLLTAGTTWACAKRWSLIAARHGVDLPISTAYAAYYRSQLINATLPGGVVGDVHRGVRHGWRPVLWERGIGQVVQIALVGTLLLPGEWRLLGFAAFAIAVIVNAVVALSALNTTGHLLVFLVAAQAAGTDLPLSTLVPIGALVLLGASIPLNIAGWGPREGIAVWAFTAYGSTAAIGLTVAVTFGVLSTLATLPGLLVLGRRRD